MSNKAMDSKGRWRSKTVSFRVSDAEGENLDFKVALSGLPKQKYILKALNESTFTVVASTRMRKSVREEIGKVCAELRRIRRCGDMPIELIEKLDILCEFAGSFSDVESPVETAEALIKAISRTGIVPDQSSNASLLTYHPKEDDNDGTV